MERILDVLDIHERLRHTQLKAELREPFVLTIVRVVRLTILEQLRVAPVHRTITQVVDVEIQRVVTQRTIPREQRMSLVINRAKRCFRCYQFHAEGVSGGRMVNQRRLRPPEFVHHLQEPAAAKAEFLVRDVRRRAEQTFKITIVSIST